jgi:hypothetical protein
MSLADKDDCGEYEMADIKILESSDIELVIKISEAQKEMVDAIMELPPQVENDLISAIRHGTLLPKGHGRLVDADAYAKRFDTNINGNIGGEYMMAPTIIEADKDKE